MLTIASALLVANGIALLAAYGGAVASAARTHGEGLAAFAIAQELRQAEASSAAAPAGAASPAATTGAGSAPAFMATRTHLATAAGTPSQVDWSQQRIAAYEDLKRAGGLDAIPAAVMRIPSVALEIPVYVGTEEVNLTRGAGVIEGTAMPGTVGNTGIAAHRDGYFRSLKDVAMGDLVELETADAVHRYRVSEIFIVTPDDIEILDPIPRNVLTLVTCYPFYFVGSAPERYIVRAEAI